MPLYKRKPFNLKDAPQDLEQHQKVFHIRFTKEIFTEYQEYLKRLNLYRQRVWTCRVTGKINLSYEEALVSEQHATEKVLQFPKELVAPVLHMIQYSTLGLNVLVDTVRTKLQERLFEGMELQGKNHQSVSACNIIEILEDGDNIKYKVGWTDENKIVTGTAVLNREDLIHKKPPVSRSDLKAFIRESTSRSAPWVVHEELAKKHDIVTEPPEELFHLFQDTQSSKVNKKRKNTDTENENGKQAGGDAIFKKAKKEDDNSKELPVKYPIDDLLVHPTADDPVFTDPPRLSTDFNVPMDCVGDLLMAWNFCTSFSRLLNLWPFSLEDFENAICHKDGNPVLVAESHSAILRFLIKDGGDYSMVIRKKNQKTKISRINWSNYLSDFLEMQDTSDFSSHVSTIRRGHYSLLDIHVKLAILRELVSEALITDAIRGKLDEFFEQQQTLTATKRGKEREIKQEQHLKNDESGNMSNVLKNGKANIDDSNAMPEHNGDALEDGTVKTSSSKRSHISDNGVPKGGNSKKGEIPSGVSDSMKRQKRGKDKNKENLDKNSDDELKAYLEREIEKSAVRVNSLGKDRNYNRYWFFRRDGRLFVESSDGMQWGYYAAKEELDELIGSLNRKGERERALQRQLEKCYHRISAAMQKRTKDVANRILRDEAELRRSTRVQAKERDTPAKSFLQYVNKWKDSQEPST